MILSLKACAYALQDETPIELDDSSDDDVKEVTEPAAEGGRSARIPEDAAAAAATNADAPGWMAGHHPGTTRIGVQTRRGSRRPLEPTTAEKFKVGHP